MSNYLGLNAGSVGVDMAKQAAATEAGLSPRESRERICEEGPSSCGSAFLSFPHALH